MNTLSSPKVPRIESLHHRLTNAKDADGQPLALLDELMVVLEDPPSGVGDRWQAGADWCAAQGIATSRVAVWSFIGLMFWNGGARSRRFLSKATARPPRKGPTRC